MPIERLALNEIEIKSGTGFLEQHSVKDTYPLHTHDFYELFYVKEGRAIHVVNNENQLLSKGSFVFIRPNDVHKYDFFKSFDFEFITMGIPVAEVEAVIKWLEVDLKEMLEAKMPPHIILEGYTSADILRKLEHIGKMTSWKERRLYFHSIFPLLVYQFLIFNRAREDSPTVPNWFVDLLEQMSRSENFTAGLHRMLDLANYSQEHLTRVFKRCLNITPTEYINIKRMEYAAELLKSGNYRINDVCYKCGCNNLSHFYHLFKKHYDCSPKKFGEVRSSLP